MQHELLVKQIPASKLYPTLLALLEEAEENEDDDLADKITKISDWIEDCKTGFLTAKKFVGYFLRQFIADAWTYLDLNYPSTEQVKAELLSEMTDADRYWFENVFPAWLAKKDDKLPIWKNKIINGLSGADDDYLEKLARAFDNRDDVTFLMRYIADFSMSTDMIVSYHHQIAFSLQLTTLRLKYCDEKIQKWQNNLQYWHIDRGIFVSFDPSEEVARIINQLLWQTKNLKEGQYIKVEPK
ncbi:MAG: hypothetical protein AAFO95_12720 [Cyanobacteria bacterium J06600_6]